MTSTLSKNRTPISPPERVEILQTHPTYAWKWKPGQFAYAVSFTIDPVDSVDRGFTSPGSPSYGVAKQKDMQTGVYYFTADAVRFTRKPRDLTKSLSEDEKVAVDLLVSQPHGAQTILDTLVPKPVRQLYVKFVAERLRNLQAR